MNATMHPASSVEFLSRHYDGELSAAEREAFDAHRAECETCRAAAAEFSRSLQAFRASPTAPAAADLSARILRKIRAQSPSRRPFGVMFGIDVRWAGVLVAALVAVRVSRPIVLRRPPMPAAGRPPIPARIIEVPSEEKTRVASGETRAAPRSEANAPAPAAPPQPRPKDEGSAADNLAPPARPEPAAEPPADDEKRRFAPAPAPAQAQAAPKARTRAVQDASGGEAAAPGVAETLEAPVPRLIVQAFDGGGLPPAVVSHPSDSRLSALRGREYILTVEAGGRVRSFQASTSSGFTTFRKEKSATDAVAPGPDDADALRELRFAPGERPRRLLVRIE